MSDREPKLLILVADDDPAEAKALCTELGSMGSVHRAADGIVALERIMYLSPDLLVLDMILPGMDGLSVLRRIPELNLYRLPHVIALIGPGQEALGLAAVELGAGAVLDRSVLPQALPDAVATALSGSRRRLLRGAALESRLYEALIEVGIARHLKGFGYLMEAILLVLEDADYKNNFSKRLYPVVARRYNTTASCVERSIRHAVESACSRIRLSVLQREFGNTLDSDRGKPTNSEFIARMADKMRNGGAYIPGGE